MYPIGGQKNKAKTNPISGPAHTTMQCQEKKKDKRQTSQEGQTTSLTRETGNKINQLAMDSNMRTRQSSETADICQKSCMVQGVGETGASGNQSRPARQRKGRLFLYHGFDCHCCRGHWWFCRQMEHQGYFQKYQASL